MSGNINDWVSVRELRMVPTRLAEVPSIANKFIFYSIRPIRKCTVIASDNTNLDIEKNQPSLIAGLEGDFFVCYKRHGAVDVGDRFLRYSAYEISRAPECMFKKWHLSLNNLYQGGFEVFNGPNAIIF